MSTLNAALRCLKHPASLFSIGLLLANDHWLKASLPSWWTGKLSDFAGLFFFPFLVAPLLGLLLVRKTVSPIMIGRFAFALTGIWFASLKMLPMVNAATCALLGTLLGHPVQLIRDPTDLIALTALVPAWLLWKHEARTNEDKPGKRAWLALAAAVLATAGTSPAPEFYNINQLEEEGGKLYAYGTAGHYDDSGKYLQMIPSQVLASSADGGRTWTRYSTDRAPFSPSGGQGCDPRNARICYRILPEQVEASHDGGKMYEVAWSIPWGRRYFMERENKHTGLAPEKKIDMGPYDLIFAPPVGANGLSTVFFAMGNEGVLVRTPEGTWQRYAIETAKPTPFSSEDAFDPLRIMPIEADVAVFMALVTFSLLSFRTASTFKRLGGSTRSVAWAVWPLVLIALLFLVGWATFAWNGFYRIGPFFLDGIPFLILLVGPFPQYLLVPLLFMILPGILLVLAWKRIAQLNPGSGVALATFWRAARDSIGFALVTFGPLVLWAFGIIPLYEWAVALAILLAGVLVMVGIKRVPGAEV